MTAVLTLREALVELLHACVPLREFLARMPAIVPGKERLTDDAGYLVAGRGDDEAVVTGGQLRAIAAALDAAENAVSGPGYVRRELDDCNYCGRRHAGYCVYDPRRPY